MAFAGHLSIDRARRQIQREMVPSLSLSHNVVWNVCPCSLTPQISFVTCLFFGIVQREAVSTPHFSQQNTIEYEMAMSWCLLQSRSDKWWAKLYEVKSA